MFRDFGNFGMMGWGGWGFWMLPIFIWGIFIKGYALWKSARAGEKYWFIALLILQTWGVAELLYLFVFARDKMTISEVKSDLSGKKKSKK